MMRAPIEPSNSRIRSSSRLSSVSRVESAMRFRISRRWEFQLETVLTPVVRANPESGRRDNRSQPGSGPGWTAKQPESLKLAGTRNNAAAVVLKSVNTSSSPQFLAKRESRIASTRTLMTANGEEFFKIPLAGADHKSRLRSEVCLSQTAGEPRRQDLT